MKLKSNKSLIDITRLSNICLWAFRLFCVSEKKKLKHYVTCFFMYVPCILHVFFISINIPQYICIYYLIIFILWSLLLVSIHLYHPQGVPKLYIVKVMSDIHHRSVHTTHQHTGNIDTGISRCIYSHVNTILIQIML